jgi:RimJ/RimL family protein N-acetyltransferase
MRRVRRRQPCELARAGVGERRRAAVRPEVIPGERIFLSHVLADDVAQIAHWKADLETTAYMSTQGDSFTVEQVAAWQERMSRESPIRGFAIIVREGERLIGDCWLTNVDEQHGVAELGIAIGDKSAWGRGYGSEAVRLLVEYAFVFLNLHTVYLWHHAFNERGHRAYLRDGFREAGRLRGATLFDGDRYDRVLMEITREEAGPSRLRRLVSQVGEREPG